MSLLCDIYKTLLWFEYEGEVRVLTSAEVQGKFA